MTEVTGTFSKKAIDKKTGHQWTNEKSLLFRWEESKNECFFLLKTKDQLISLADQPFLVGGGFKEIFPLNPK